MTTEEMLQNIMKRLEERVIPVEVDMWDTERIAAYMKLSYSTVRDKILTRPGFPRPHRLGSGRAKPIYKATEVIAWTESQP